MVGPSARTGTLARPKQLDDTAATKDVCSLRPDRVADGSNVTAARDAIYAAGVTMKGVGLWDSPTGSS